MEETGIVFEAWHYWFVAALLLMVLEAFVPGFVLGCLAIGSLGGLVASLFTDSWEIQLLAVSGVSVLAFVFVRPFALKRLFKTQELKTNIDSLIGRRAKVTQSFDRDLLKGRVGIDGDDWMAYSKEPGDLHLGQVVEILEVQSNTLIVKPIPPST